MAYGDFEDLPRRAARDKYLGDKPFNIAKGPKYDGYQRRIASMVYSFFEKKRLLVVVLNLFQISYNLEMNLINQLLENL